MGGFPSSSSRSSTCCSSTESTSAIVATTCCASTARHTAWRSGAALEATSGVVQVVDDTNESLDRREEVDGTRRERQVVRREPGVRGRLMPPQRIERAKEAHEQQRELPFLGPCGRQLVTARAKARRRGVRHAENVRELTLRKRQQVCGSHHRLGQDLGLGYRLRCTDQGLRPHHCAGGFGAHPFSRKLYNHTLLQKADGVKGESPREACAPPYNTIETMG